MYSIANSDVIYVVGAELGLANTRSQTCSSWATHKDRP